MICDPYRGHINDMKRTWKTSLFDLGQWWYFVVFAVVLMCVNLGNEKCGIQPRFRNRLLGWKNKSVMIQLAKIALINIIFLNFCKMVTISAIWNCYLKRSPFLWSSPWWSPELCGHSVARWNGLLFKLLSLAILLTLILRSLYAKTTSSKNSVKPWLYHILWFQRNTW